MSGKKQTSPEKKSKRKKTSIKRGSIKKSISQTKSARSYNGRTLKMLWGRSAGRCATPECRIQLFVDATDHDPMVIIGDIAHIHASSSKGPRATAAVTRRKLDEYDNLILLCKNCHFRIDQQKRTNTVEMIKRLKEDHEAWVRESLPERGQNTIGWDAVVLQGQHPIDNRPFVSAISPDFLKDRPTIIEANPRVKSWDDNYKDILRETTRLLSMGDHYDLRFAIFPLAPVSACVALGFCLTDRPRVRLFQYHRHAQSWKWIAPRNSENIVDVVGLPARVNRKRGEVVVCFELSAQIQRGHINSFARNAIGAIYLRLAYPSTSWLHSINQLEELGRIAHDTFECIQNRFPNATCWHLFLATPAPAAVKIGQAMNPSMTPPVQLYEFNRCATPTYVPSIRLEGGDA